MQGQAMLTGGVKLASVIEENLHASLGMGLHGNTEKDTTISVLQSCWSTILQTRQITCADQYVPCIWKLNILPVTAIPSSLKILPSSLLWLSISLTNGHSGVKPNRQQ